MGRSDFRWRDGDREIVFRAGLDLAGALGDRGWDGAALLTTARAEAGTPSELTALASGVRHVPPGQVTETAAALADEVPAGDLIALGGGRVIDTAKAIAAVRGGRVAAIPTTLSGAEMTSIHRLPPGREARHGQVRPALVLADPALMTSHHEPELRASAMNALAHGADCLYTPMANPVSRMAALEGARLIAAGLEGSRSGDLALGSILCAYALESAGLALHHVISQTLVRIMEIPHAPANAAILPRAIEALLPRAPGEMQALAEALGTGAERLPERVEALAGGRVGLGSIGARTDRIPEALDTMLAREAHLARVPDPPGREELRRIVDAAW